MKYAVNIGDITGDTLLAQLLIAPVIQSKVIVDVERGRVDGKAVLLDTDEVRADAICQIVRVKYPDKSKMRCYVSKTGNGGWKRI